MKPVCRLCGGADLRPAFTVKGVSLRRCVLCGFVQVLAPPSAEELADIYGEAYFASGKYRDEATQARENRRRLAFIGRWLPAGRGMKLLDFGCAVGDFTAAAARSHEVWGHDLSPQAVAAARNGYPHLSGRFSSGPSDTLDFPPDFFDAILLWDVIEHLRDPAGVCRRLLPHLKPGGFLFVSTPDIGAVNARLLGRYWAFMTPPEHLGFFSRSTLGRLLEEDLQCRIVARRNRGKWVNAGFLLYKIRRIFPRLLPAALPRFFQSGPWHRIGVYVPTADILYVAARKPGSGLPGAGG